MSEADHTGVVLDGRYRVGARLGQGGMGTVYAAEHVGLGQRRAIKFLRPDIARKPGSVKRFLQEARVLSAMHHENLVGVVDMGEYAGSAYYVMEFLEGEDLRTRLRRLGMLSWPETRTVALQVCEALRLTHGRGIVHRDLKPENCYCVGGEAGEGLKIKLIDFGVAKVPKEVGGTSQLTGTGETLGTIGYMAPEQLEGQGDHRVDVYSLGVMMFEMLAGRPVYSGNAFEVIAKMLRGEVTSLAGVCPGVDPAIEGLIARATDRDPSRRFETMEAFAAAIVAIPDTAEPQIVVDRRVTEPDRPRIRGSMVDVGAPTMPGSEPDLKDTFGSSDTMGAAERSAAAPMVALGEAPAVVTMDGPPPRSRALWVVAAAFAGAVGVAWVAWPQGLGERVTDVDTKEVVDEKATDVAAKAVAVDTKANAGDAKAVVGEAKAVGEETKAVGGETKAVDGDAKAIVGGETKAGGGDGKAETKAGEAKTVTPPGVRLLTREQLKRRLGSELAACRSKFADESIVVRVTPGRGGKVDKLASVDDGQLASGMVRCVEKELARMLVGLKDGVEAKKTFDVSLTLPKAG